MKMDSRQWRCTLWDRLSAFPPGRDAMMPLTPNIFICGGVPITIHDGLVHHCRPFSEYDEQNSRLLPTAYSLLTVPSCGRSPSPSPFESAPQSKRPRTSQK